MNTTSFATDDGSNLSPAETKHLRNELWVVVPFLILSLLFFIFGFQYKFKASVLPVTIGFVMSILSGMRLFYILFPGNRFKIGGFREGGLAEDFDEMRGNIEKAALKGQENKKYVKEITGRDERKAFLALIGCFLAYLLFGYIFGVFFVIVGVSFS